MMRFWPAPFIVMACAMGTPATAGVIRGTLRVPANATQQAPAANAYPKHATVEVPVSGDIVESLSY